jgi:hypothetical protein
MTQPDASDISSNAEVMVLTCVLMSLSTLALYTESSMDSGADKAIAYYYSADFGKAP